MLTDKEQKKSFLKETTAAPEKYYATQVLVKHGFHRGHCTNCGKHFWSVHKEQTLCGDSSCQGSVTMFKNNPSKRRLTYTEVWQTFSEHMMQRGYAKISRYPVVARWNPTTDFTMASIAAFQPYVISGEVEPPAKKLVIPQFCLRFGDVDNVGVTGSHCTGFVMIGQHQFVPKEEWNQNQAFEDLLTYFTDVVGIPKEEFTLHEDAWAGGGNFGPCMEFFSRGVELSNQVYMMYEQTEEGRKELQIKVLDMGLGQERVAWFSQGAPTLYDATFPAVINKLKEITGVEFDAELYAKFAPFSTLLNLDEVEDISVAWQTVADKVGVPVAQLRSKIEPMKGIYSVAEHSRALLVALSDGGLPGNVGGYYNLRVIFRRAQQFIDHYKWDLDIAAVAGWHAQELQHLFPELLENLPDVQRILSIELTKYRELLKRNEGIIQNVLKQDVSTEKLIELYDSHGIMPEHVVEQARKLGKKILVPDNFFQLVEERHAKQEQKTQTRIASELPLHDVPPTKPLYYQGYDIPKAKGHVLFVHENQVVLDQTIFYPTSGGQLHDTGQLISKNEVETVVSVFKQGKHVVHVMAAPSRLVVGDEVHEAINMDRRMQLAQHHTAAHIINGAARKVLGNHIWQAGAAKTVEKGRLDITHYDTLSQEQLQAIEDEANAVVRSDLPVMKHEMKKSVAEAEYGFRLYQGGAVPGNTIRVIQIPNFDTEACGGTHLHTTGEEELIKILRSSKIQDGIIRIEYVAGAAAKALIAADQAVLRELETLLKVPRQYVPGRIEELFNLWKKAKKAAKDGKPLTAAEKELHSMVETQANDSELLSKCAALLSTQKEHVVKTVQRFLDELVA
jgi:alanyl-tRNA synthetase